MIWQYRFRMVASVVKQLGRLDIAINNAGMNKNHAAEDCSASDWDQTFELNTKGVFLCCQVYIFPFFYQDFASVCLIWQSHYWPCPTLGHAFLP